MNKKNQGYLSFQTEGQGRNLHGQPSLTHELHTTLVDQEFYLLTHVDPLQTTKYQLVQQSIVSAVDL